MTHILARARRLALRRVFAEVSTTARPFFASMGFRSTRTQVRVYRNCAFKQFCMERRV